MNLPEKRLEVRGPENLVQLRLVPSNFCYQHIHSSYNKSSSMYMTRTNTYWPVRVKKRHGMMDGPIVFFLEIA
jgi:hypothetical protein